MEKLTKENFDRVMHCGENLLLYFYKEGDAASFLGMNTITDVQGLHGKNFQIYMIDTNLQPEICDAFSHVQTPEFISMKGCKIHKRSQGILTPSQALDLLK